MNLDGFSLHPLAIELNDALSGGRIDKITQPNKHTIIMSIRQPGKNYLVRFSINPQNPSVYLINNTPENPPEPPVFCMVLRKHLETGRIVSVRQHGLDRIFIIEIDVLAAAGKITTKSLYIELMGKYSNIILTTDGIITDALRKVGINSSRIRTVLPGQPYELPPQQDKLNLLDISIPLIVQRIAAQSGQKLSKAILDVCLGFGPVSAKEAAYLTSLPINITVNDLQTCDLITLEQALNTLKESSTPTGLHYAPSIITDNNKKILAAAAFSLHVPTGTSTSFVNMSKLLAEADNLLGSYVPPDKERFTKLIATELHRAKNKLGLLNSEMTEAENATEWKLKGDNLMTYQHTLKDHENDAVTVADIYSPEGRNITIELDKSITVSQNCQNFYRKYNKLKRAQQLLKEQLDACKANIKYLESVTESLKSSTTLTEINDIHEELISAGFLLEKPKKKTSDKPSSPFEFISPSGMQVLVGKNNLQNDRLTFKIAGPNDLWFHTKDIPGSHVILRTDNNEPTDEDILFAAQTAAAFSKASASSNVPVDHTRCRFVKKPSGAKPGFVIFTNQNTVYVTPKHINQPI